MKSFRARLEHLQNGLTQKDFAKKLGVPLNTYTAWLREERLPSFDAIQKICTVLGVSADWLLTGREGVTTTLRYGFRERLFEARGATGLDIPGLAKKLGVPAAEVEELMNKGGDPSLAMVDAFERKLQPVIEQRRKEDPMMARLANIERLLIKLAGEQS